MARCWPPAHDHRLRGGHHALPQEASGMIRHLVRPLAVAFAAAAAIVDPASAQDGPRFRADGPNAELYGLSRGYPMCSGLTYIDDKGCRVGAFSNYGSLFPSRVIRAPSE